MMHTEPALLGRHTAIARAAAFSGFDPTNLENLVHLVNAVRRADLAIYPDYYDGEGEKNQFLYPDFYDGTGQKSNGDHEDVRLGASANDSSSRYSNFWFSSSSSRHKSVIQAYRDADRMQASPHVSYTTSKVGSGSNNFGNGRPRPRLTGANLEPVCERPSKKRTNTADFLRNTPEPKKVKAETNGVAQTIRCGDMDTVIDLTKDDIITNTSPLIDLVQDDKMIMALPFRPRRKSKKPKQCLPSPAESQSMIRAKTRAEFEKVLLRLRGNEQTLRKNRDVLRQRWELDVELQLQTVTNHLKQLNDCFERAEQAIQEATSLVASQFGVGLGMGTGWAGISEGVNEDRDMNEM
jgi:hypothetical protein